MAFLLYVATAIALLGLAHRFVRPVSRAAMLVLLVLPLFLTGHALLTNGVLGPIDHPYQSEPLLALKTQHGIDIGRPHNIVVTDIYTQMMPWRRAVQLSLARGEWPLWNPWILCGHLLAGAAQPAVYSPFTLIACLLPAAQSFAYTAAIAFFLAGLSAFVFARELDCVEGAALLGAAGWMFSTSLVLYILWPLAFAWTLFPFVLAAARRVVHQPGVASGAILMCALTLMLLSGHPETVLHAVILGSLYAAFEMIRARIRPAKPIATALAAGIVTLLLCAIYLLPVAEAVSQSAEYAYKKAVWAKQDRGSPRAWVAAMITMDVFPHLHVRYWSKPELRVLKPETSSVGSLVLAFAIYALWRRRSAEAFFFAFLAIACITVEVEWGPAANALRHLPLLDITHNER
ncbi:MAG TPA: hypothetical protein VMU84_19920, partial [Thermoanaerobaculia bacterium]|nr:hypothetical protein [Thermoanaerobaculia bacterium]